MNKPVAFFKIFSIYLLRYPRKPPILKDNRARPLRRGIKAR